MGQDYTARKAAKKGRKRVARDGASKDATGRVRKKKNQPRRLCRGPCYQPPALTEEDREWDGRPEGGDGFSDEEGEFSAAARAARVAATTAAAGYDSDSDGGGAGAAAHGREKRQKTRDALAAGQAGGGSGGVKMSTSIRLLDPSALAALAAEADAARGGTDGAKKKRKADGENGGAGGGAGGGSSAPVEVPEALKAFPPLVGSCMVSLSHSEPTPIQSAAWPPACEGRDVQAVAEPGSGKTLGYLLPAMMRVAEAQEGGEEDGVGGVPAPLALVLAPTRELAMQVAGQARALRGAARVSTTVVYGGVPREQQIEALAKHPALLVATPGRLLDLIDAGALSLSRVRCVVLDEADKMVAVGFAPQLDRLRGMLLPPAAAAAADSHKKKKKRGEAKKEAGQSGEGRRPQVLLFTATMPESVEEAAGAWLAAGAARVQSAPSAASISKTITQVVHVCAEHKKPAKLAKHLTAIRAASAGARNPPRVLVFANRVKTVKFLLGFVTKEGWRAEALHGQRSQWEREAAVAAFRAGKVQLLVASDVASRGLDIRGLPYVVNYDFPSRLETYVHRVGRTGRLAAGGHAYSFFTRNLARLAPDLVELLTAHGQPVDPNLARLADAWKEAERQLAAAGRAPPGGEEGEEGEEEEEEVGDAAAGVGAVEDLQEGLPPPAQGSAQRAPARGGAAPTDVFAAAMGDLLTSEGLAGLVTDAEDNAGGSEKEEKEPAAAAKKKRKAAARGGPATGLATAAAAAFGQLLASGGGGDSEPGEGSGAPAPGKKKRRQADGDVLLVPRAKGDRGGSSGAAAGDREVSIAPSSFIPSPKFVGARPGFVFKKGDRGVGYYPDTKGKGGAAAVAKAVAAAAAAAGGVANGAAQPKQRQQQKKKEEKKGAAAAAKPKLPPLPGTKAARRSQHGGGGLSSDSGDDSDGGAAAAGGVGGGSDGSDSDGPPAQRGLGQRLERGGKRKALPGRLRKKLARSKQREGGSGGSGKGR